MREVKYKFWNSKHSFRRNWRHSSCVSFCASLCASLVFWDSMYSDIVWCLAVNAQISKTSWNMKINRWASWGTSFPKNKHFRGFLSRHGGVGDPSGTQNDTPLRNKRQTNLTNSKTRKKCPRRPEQCAHSGESLLAICWRPGLVSDVWNFQQKNTFGGPFLQSMKLKRASNVLFWVICVTLCVTLCVTQWHTE